MSNQLTDPSQIGSGLPQAPPINPRTNLILTLAAVVLTVAVLSMLAGVVIIKRHIVFRHRSTVDTLVLAAANITGDDPFISAGAITLPPVSAAAAQQIATTTEQLPTSPDRGVRLVAGTHPGLYGVAGQQSSCDAAAITNALDSRPDAGLAWAQAQSIQSDQIPYYMNTLTPVVLTADTWVTSYSFTAGKAAAHQAVLQAGSAVMIDAAGVPRLRCASGDPLRPPASENIAALPQTKTSWPGYSPQSVVAIAYTNAPASFTDPVPTRPAAEFSVIDLDSGAPQTRKAGRTIDIPLESAASASLPDPIANNTPPAPHER